MSIDSIKQALQAQANFIKGQTAVKTKAQMLRELAAELDKQAAVPSKFSFKEITKKKTAAEFAANTRELELKEIDANMQAHKWVKFAQDDEKKTRSYSNNVFKHYRIVLRSGKFDIFYKNDLQIAGIVNTVDPHTLTFLNPARFIKVGADV